MSRHADAAWKVQERGAPSPRAYIRLVNAWMTRVRARIARMMGPHADATPTEDEHRQQMELFLIKLRSPGALPPPPDPADIASVGAPAVKQAARASRQGLLVAGYPRVELERRMVQSGAAPGTSLVGIDIAPTDADRLTLRTWAKDGTDLIKTVEQDLVAGLDRYIVEALREGRYDLGTIVQERLGVSQRHAQFIARDQIAKLNAAVTQGTQRAAGVTQYRWRSSRDERTRPMHRALDGTVHSWDDPPVTAENGATNHPGEDFQCRCVGIGVVPSFSEQDEPNPIRPSPAAPMPREAPSPLPSPVLPAPTPQPRRAPRDAPPELPSPVLPTSPRAAPTPQPRRAPRPEIEASPPSPRPRPPSAGTTLTPELDDLPSSTRTVLGQLPLPLDLVRRAVGATKAAEALAVMDDLEKRGLVKKTGTRIGPRKKEEPVYDVTDLYREIVKRRPAGVTDEDLIAQVLGL